jgi:hypothetical protein
MSPLTQSKSDAVVRQRQDPELRRSAVWKTTMEIREAATYQVFIPEQRVRGPGSLRPDDLEEDIQ